MFKEIIASSPFTTDVANRCFANIRGASLGGDISFLATLRALLAPRLSESDELELYITRTSFSPSQTDSWSNLQIAEKVIDRADPTPSNSLHIHLCSSPIPDVNETCVTAVYDNAMSILGDDWIRVDKVTAMFRQRKFMTACFVNPVARNAIVFVSGGDLRRYHMIQASISVFLPWYFESGGKVLTDEEFRLVSALFNSKEPNDYISCISALAEKYDFKGMRIRQMLAGFESRIDERRKADVERQIQDLNSNIVSLNAIIDQKIRLKNEYNLTLLGLETKIAQGKENSEIMNYFLRSSRLALESVDGSSITFAVKDYTLYFDEANAQRAIDNKSSYIYRNQRNGISGDDMALLMKSIFIDQVLKLRTCAAYRLTIGSNVEPMQNYEFDSSEYDEYMPNTHIQDYGCLGTYRESLNTLMSNCDYIGAIEQCMASARSLNFGDLTVMSKFVYHLYMDNYCCIELPNGKVVVPSEAIAWLKKEDVNE